MEKFAVDLDKVLDEFEFNEDRAEQVAVAALADPPKCIGSPPIVAVLSRGSKKVYRTIHTHNEVPAKVVTASGSSESAKHESSKNTDRRFDNIDSVNHQNVSDNKTKKQSAETVDSESASVTVRNEPQKQKRQNENGSAKRQNSYDKKLNQPNIKPSVSNVFSSLNEYINAPSVSLAGVENLSESEGTYKASDGAEAGLGKSVSNEKTLKNLPKESFPKVPDETKPKSDDAQKVQKTASVPPKYQNILLPVKLQTSEPNESRVRDLGVSENPSTSDRVDSLINNKDSSIKKTVDEPDRIYENVYVGTDVPKAQDIYATVNKPPKENAEEKHTYENLNFGKQETSRKKDDGAYECIYIGNRENLPETTTDLEIAAKKMSEQFNAKIQKDSEVKSASTRLVFQNVQLGAPQQLEQKPIGFSNIDDMSEEELNKYLAELEAEERAKEEAEASMEPKMAVHHDDEDANEAPIFESVTIGELPTVPEEDLQAKAKKFPVIDYSRASMGEASKDFSVLKKDSDSTDEKSSRRSRKNVEKTKDDNAPETFHGDTVKNAKEYENCVSENRINESTDEAAANVEDKGSGDLRSSAANVSHPADKIVEKNEQIQPTLEKTVVNAKSTKKEHTETISRFSVTTNVDINDKLGTKHSKIVIGESNSDADSVPEEGERPARPQTLDIVSTVDMSDNSTNDARLLEEAPSNEEMPDGEEDTESVPPPSPDALDNASLESGIVLGKQPPFWVPDSEAPNCMQCDVKFTVIKRRHHCRACGKVLCSKCCNMKYRLEYQSNMDSRVCLPCYQLLIKENDAGSGDWSAFSNSIGTNPGINSPQGRQPNPNNPMEYCSTIPPLQQLAGGLPPPPTVMVPVGVLKREGSTKQRAEGPKSVMFSDGIRPGCDLTELDITPWDWKPPAAWKVGTKRVAGPGVGTSSMKKQNLPPVDPSTNSYIPSDPNALPPTVTIHKGQITYHEVTDQSSLFTSLKNECEPPVMFAINRNLYAYMKIINLNCCVNRICWNITSKGLACVGQDEVIFLIETLPDENQVPKDLLLHINQIYYEATKGNTITEYGMSIHQSGNLLGSREHAGFLFIRQTLQCLQKIVLPPAPFLVGLLVHRWETPWAKVFPLRLVLRLGAEYRYYPCPLVSVRFRDAVYFEIGHTIMKVLADFRNFAYTLPSVQGLTIHMQDRVTFVRFPKNRYNQVIQGLNNSNDHVLAYASNFSVQADSHLVCIQTNSEDESIYQTQAINIQNMPRVVTGASFIVINGALKSSMGLSAKSSIVEDGLMVQIMPEKMEALKAALKNMQDFTIGCGLQGAAEPDETVNIKWVENDVHFNLNVKSPIDCKPMDGIPSIRVHNGTDFIGKSRFIRWTEVFIIKSDDDQPFAMHYPVDINKLSESIARATCTALVRLLDLLATAGLTKIAVRTTIHPDNVGYEAGSEGMRLPPIYMNSLDNELIQVLQKAVQGCEDTQTVLELIFHVLEMDNNS